VEFEPAGRFEFFMETSTASPRKEDERRRHAEELLQAAVIGHAYVNDIALPKIHVFLQRVLFAVLAPIGRLFGYRA
jgi:hypothetical protein